MKKNRSTMDVRTVATLGVFSAIAYVLMFVSRLLPPIIPAVPFLKYDPKDFIIVICGFLFGPLPSLAVIVIVSLIEMITVSTTGPIGLLMNILSSAFYVLPAAFIYQKKRDLSGAVIGLLTGTVSMTAIMLLWNYLITPLYMQIPREAVKALLIPSFLPFNAIKGILNSAFALLLYKPLVMALKQAHVLPSSDSRKMQGNRTILAVLLAVVLIVSAVLLILALNKGV